MPVIDQHIVWVYTEDLEQTDTFYRSALGLECLLDEGAARIFQVTQNSMIGVCSAFEDRIVEPRGTMISFVTSSVDEWYAKLSAAGVSAHAPPHRLEAFNIYTFFVDDPNGYVIEFQQFLSPKWAPK